MRSFQCLCWGFKTLSNVFKMCFKALRSPHSAYVLVLTLFTIFGVPFIAKDLPLSKLYMKFHTEDEIYEVAKDLNAQRVKNAFSYFEKLESGSSQAFYGYNIGSNSPPDIVVAILTVSRQGNLQNTHYLMQTAAIVDRIIKEDTLFTAPILFICNVDPSPGQHKDAVLLKNYMPFVEKNGSNSFNETFKPYSYRSMHKDVKRGQETMDYLFCLNVSQSMGSPYVLLLEDDVIPYSNLFKVLHYTLQRHKLIHSSHSESATSQARMFSFLKLYYPERWQGFANEADRILELLCYGLVGGSLLLFTIFICWPKSEPSYAAKLFYYTIGFSITIYSVLIIDRHNVMDLRRISPQLFRFRPTPACCTPAMLYTSEIIPILIDHLVEQSHLNKDLAIYDFIDKNHIPGYFLEPNLVRHIGMFSSLQDSHKPPFEFIFHLE
ncbi:post-GPI attachment to proteins factor 4-like [Dreissena polymorpha]|uniref:Uncharacterized protein n=1 Tax=Dreissena polymorpha TaxID=45954 RepID=A0A9D4R1B6_DREPO|nr:post-GPI attachment to proteins factor 4-like [Dreissena polymorpha]KAH3851294.1 hypothetical protein DPMN_093774 [Dreissena polymorpha]